MKEGWEIKKLGEVGTITRGKGIQKVDFVKKGLPCVHYGQIHTSFGTSTDKHISEISEELYASSNKAKYGDLLFALTSEDVEGSCKATAWMGNYEVAVSSDAAIFSHSLNPLFVSYYFHSKAFYRQKAKCARGFKVTHIKTADIIDFFIPVPSTSEQAHIVNELNSLSSIILHQKAQLAELDKLAQSIFYNMFGNPDADAVDREHKLVKDCFSFIRNGANIKQTKGANGFPITRIESLSGGVFNRNRLGFANIYDIKGLEKYILDDGDILMSHINSKTYIGRCIAYKKEGDETIIHGMNLLRLKPITGIVSSVYIKYFFDTPFFKRQVASIRKDAVNQSSMTVSDLCNLIVYLPPIEKQQLFAKQFYEIESQKLKINQSLKETQKLFEYTMDKYFG